MAAEPIVTVQIENIRDVRGRFVRMGTGGLNVVQTEEAGALAKLLEVVYRGAAPKGTGLNRYAGGGGPFYLSLRGRFVAGAGFNGLAIETDQPDKRRWLEEGTGIYGPTASRIYPVGAQALRFEWKGQTWFVDSIAGMRKRPWEEKARALAEPVILERLKATGARIVRELAVGPVA